jgi:hypothetical protein
MYETYFLQNWLPWWNQILTHNNLGITNYIIFSFSEIFKRKNLLMSKNLKIQLMATRFEPMPCTIIYNWLYQFNQKYKKYIVKSIVILLYLLIICWKFQNKKLKCESKTSKYSN